MVYQNFLREFWSTVFSFNPFPSTGEPKKRPLKEFLIKFLALNGQRPLTLDFHTFCSSTVLDYNNGKYVAHPAPEAVKKELGKIAINRVLGGNYSSTEQVDSIQQLLAYSLITGTEVDIGEIIYRLPSTLDEGTRKSKPLPEGTATHPQDTGGNKQPLDRDITSMTPDEGTTKTMPRPEGSLGDKYSGGNIPPDDMEPIHTHVADPLGTGAKYQEVLDIGEDMDEDPHDDAEVRTPSPEPSHASIDQYYDENIAHRDQTDKLMEAFMSYLDRSSTTISDLYKGLDVITQLLKDINNALKSLTALKSEVSLEIKSMMVEIYQAFKGQPSSTPLGSVTPTLALTHIPTNAKGENATNTVTEEPPSHTEGETGNTTMAIRISSIHPTKVQPTHDQPITSVISHPESSYATPRIDKGKGITTDSNEDPSKRLVPASTIIRPDPDEPDKEEKIKKAAEEAKLLAMSRPETMTDRIKPEPITDVRIHPNTKPIVASVFRNNDKRNFDVHQPLKFSDFGITELDELGLIIQKKKNSVVKDLMTSLSKGYERFVGIKRLLDDLRVTATQLKEFDLLNWDPTRGILQLGQQVVSELVALRNFARRYGSRFCTLASSTKVSATTTTTTATIPTLRKGIVITELGTSTKTTTISSQPSHEKVQDKGKGIMVEEPVKSMTKKYLVRLDEEERLTREKDKVNVALTEE
ncbi:hypothetical protein Tco_0480636 [Tanacetum coccineum]